MNKETIKNKTKKVTEKLSELLKKTKDFSLMNYLLIRKEKKLLSLIEMNKELIEYHTQQIIIDKAHIIATECEIAIVNKEIKKLETDAKKVQKVIKL